MILRQASTASAFFLALLTLSCRSAGTVDIEVSLPMECSAPSHVAVYLIRGALCGDCECGDCLEFCEGEACTVGCQGDYCSLAEFEAGVELSPDQAGNYAVIYQFVDIDAEGVVTEQAAACIDNLQLDKDGTSNEAHQASALCCEGA